MADNRLGREATTRETGERKKVWRAPELLPSPKPQDGYSFHWVRVSIRGEADAMNVSSKLREGWEPVKAVDHPEIHMMASENSNFKDGVVIGGLMLCKAPTEFVEDRNAHYQKQADAQMQAVDNNFMRESDSRMPLFSDKKTTVTFGNGA